jgi:hypothetical protein
LACRSSPDLHRKVVFRSREPSDCARSQRDAEAREVQVERPDDVLRPLSRRRRICQRLPEPDAGGVDVVVRVADAEADDRREVEVPKWKWFGTPGTRRGVQGPTNF